VRVVIEKPEIVTALKESSFIDANVRPWGSTFRYLSQTEVHVYALAIAASVLLSFFPFLIVMLSLVRDVFHFPAAERALFSALKDYFPSDLGNEILKNLTKVTHRRFQITSLLLLLFTANGIFEPLEVALNRAWGVRENRSYLKNQLLSLFMILLCGGLALGSLLLTAASRQPGWLSFPLFRLAAIISTILSLFLTYWLLPNRRVPVKRVIPVAALVGLGMEGLKYLFLYVWPWMNLKFRNEYGETFRYSVSLIIFTMLSAFLVLAGAEWSARKKGLVYRVAGRPEED
jgi:membrane protein